MQTLSRNTSAERLRALLSGTLEDSTRRTIQLFLAHAEGRDVAATGPSLHRPSPGERPPEVTTRRPETALAGGNDDHRRLAFFRDEHSALALVERMVWPHGPVCPRCGARDRVGRLEGKSTRIGTFKCYACRRTFSITAGTVFAASHVPLHKWMQAICLTEGGTRKIAANRLARLIDVSFKTADRMQRKLFEAAVSPNGNNSSLQLRIVG